MAPQLLIIFSILGWGIGSFFYKFANNNLHPMMVSAIITCVYLCLTPLSFIFLQFDRTINTTGVIFSVLGALCMCVGSLGYFYALRNGGSVGAVTVLTSLYPALTLILSVVFLKESFSLKQGIGIVFALAACALLGLK